MKKTIWVPFVLGITLGLLDFVSLAVHFVLPTSDETFVGPQEIFETISAALGGPLGLFLTSFFQELGVHFYLLKGQLPPEQVPLEIFVSIADFSAHILASLAVVYCYRFLYQRARENNYILSWLDPDCNFLLLLTAASAIIPVQPCHSGYAPFICMDSIFYTGSFNGGKAEPIIDPKALL